jgi:acyl-CoA thioesterase FadM
MDAPQRLSHAYQVRFDEADARGWLRASGFLRYAQDMAWRHSESAGFGREWYAERRMHWLVRNVTLHVLSPVTYGDALLVTTEVTGWRHVWARRQAVVRRGGDVVATIQTDWVLLGDDGRPARVPAEIGQWFAAQQTFERSRVLLPDPPPEAARLAVRVRPLDIDPMGHMNNAAYLDVVEEAMAALPPMPEGSEAPDAPGACPADCRYRIGYLRPALPRSELDVTCWRPEATTIACRIADRDGEELARVIVGRMPDRQDRA